jgi:hypothetical protein
MREGIKVFFLVSGLLICTLLSAQHHISLGPSVAMNVDFFEYDMYPVFGGQIVYELPVRENHSFSIAGTVHYGTHANSFDATITEQNLLIGVHPEYRIHFKDRYNGSYLGIGGDVKHLTARNYFPPILGDDASTFVSWEFNIGLSYGAYIPMEGSESFHPICVPRRQSI